jgi:hypothetical protein
MADFDWGNLLYLLAIVLFAIFGSRKKKKPASASPYENENETQNEPGFFEQLFQEERIKPEPAYSPQEEENNWQRRNEYNTPFGQEDFDREEEDMVESKTQHTPEPKVEEEIFKEHLSKDTSPAILSQVLDEPFDLRRAVIYSTILERRPY